MHKAPVYFVLMLRHYCFSASKFISRNFVKLGAAVATVFAISFIPFASARITTPHRKKII
jgi:hypothetical protein